MQTKQKPKEYVRLHTLFSRWWRELQGLRPNGEPRRSASGAELPPDRQSLALLRRIKVVDRAGHPAIDVEGALGVPAFLELIKRADVGDDLRKLEAFAIAAATLARIRKDAGGEDCGATAALLGGKEPLLAEARFKRLMRTREDWPDLMAQARRLGAVLEKRAPVGDLGASLVLWNTDPTVRTRWAFNYYRGALEADDEPQQPAPTATA